MKIAVGISGGVDSTVAALLLLEAGHEVIGVTMTLGRADEETSLAAARDAARRLDIPLHVCDLSARWKSDVTDYIRNSYCAGTTPNPCIRCNERVKFGLLPRWAFDTLGCERFATGHYARLVTDGTGTHLLRGRDHAKDQSYFLYRIAPEIKSHTLFPLGTLLKAEVREKAKALGLDVAGIADSQDFCGGDPQALIDRPDSPGDILTTTGQVLGRHRGFWHYTVGMRKGLGIGGGGTVWYVVRLDARANRVIVGTREEALCHTLTLTDTVGKIDLTLPVKVRSAGEPRLLKNGIAGIAPGQSAVFYRGEEIVGGGIITAAAS